MESCCEQVEEVLEDAGRATTLHKDKGAWRKYWEPFCAQPHINIATWRVDATIKTSTQVQDREAALIYMFIMYIKSEMKAKKLVDRAAGKGAKPDSILGPVWSM